MKNNTKIEDMCRQIVYDKIAEKGIKYDPKTDMILQKGFGGRYDGDFIVVRGGFEGDPTDVMIRNWIREGKADIAANLFEDGIWDLQHGIRRFRENHN